MFLFFIYQLLTPQKLDYEDLQNKLKQVRGSSSAATAKVFILGRNRIIYKQGRTSFVRYKNKLTSLTDARKLEKHINIKKK